MKQKTIFLTLGIAIVVLAIITCKDKEDVAYRDELATMSWEKIVEYGKKEGEMTWFVWYFQPQFREVVKDFEAKYGITVTIPEGTFEGNISKVLSEKNLSVGAIDVISYGSDRAWQLLKADVFYGPVDGIIPSVERRKSKIEGSDTKGYGLSYWGNQTGFAYDPKRIAEDDVPQTLADIQAYVQQYPKMFSFSDPNGGGSGEAFIMSLVRALVPQEYGNELEERKTAAWQDAWKWFNENAENYVITASNADSLTRLNDGEFALTAAWEDHMATLQKQGAISSDLRFYIPRMGMPGGANFASVVKNAPHPAASLVFLHWLTSKETQTTFNKDMGAAPQNSKADDTYSLIPQEMRKHSIGYVPDLYRVEMKKQFVSEVLIQ